MVNFKQGLKNKFNALFEVVDERDMIRRYNNKSNIDATLMVAVEPKHTCSFKELIQKYNTLRNKYEYKCEQVNTLYKKNDRLRLNKKQLNDKLNEQETLTDNINSTHSTIENDAQELEYRLSRINATIDNLKDMQRQTQLKLNDMDQNIVCAKNTIAEKIAQCTRLENQIDDEWEKSTSLQVSISDRMIEHDQITSSLRTEIDQLRNQLDEKTTELTNSKRRLNKTQQQYEIQNEKTKELKANFNHLQGVYEKEKYNALKEIFSLQQNIKSLTTKHTLINTHTIYDTQIENGKLKLKLEDQNNTFKKLITNKEHLQQEVNRNKQATELARQELLTKRKQRHNEMKLHESKLLLKNQEKSDLKIFIRDQVRQIKKLKMEITAIKPTAVPQSSQMSFTKALKTHLDLLYAEDEIPVIDATTTLNDEKNV